MPATQTQSILVPAQIAEETGLVEVELLEQVIVPGLPIFESGGSLRSRARRVLRYFGVLPSAPMGRNLAAAGEVAVRVTTAQGRSATIAIPDSVLGAVWSGETDIWAYLALRFEATV